MSSRLIHKMPCPHSPFAPVKPWPRFCNCPTGWPQYEDDLLRRAENAVKTADLAGSPRLLLTFTLHNGELRQKACGWQEAVLQLAEAKGIPRLWRDFKIEPDVCARCGERGEMTVAGKKPGELLRVCAEHIDDYREAAEEAAQ